MPAWMAPRLAPPVRTNAVVMTFLSAPGGGRPGEPAASVWASPLPAAAPFGRGSGVRARESGQRQRAEQETEVPERDVAVPADEQQADDDAGEPAGYEEPAEARREQDDEPGDDLDAAHHVHRVLRAAGDDVVELGRQVARPIVRQ